MKKTKLYAGIMSLTKRKFNPVIISLLLCITLLASCSNSTNTTTSSVVGSNTATSTTSTTITTAEIKATTVSFKESDYYFDWKNSSYTTITLNGDSAAVTGANATATGSVVTITASGTYVISGTLNDGSIVVNIDKTVDTETIFLVLNGADITSKTSAPIYVMQSDKTVILMENGTQNSVFCGSGCVVNAEGEPSAAIFSKSKLTIGGSGTLNVTSEFNDGITSKDVLKITDGTFVLNVKSDGIVGKDSLNIEKANITITAGKDGMKASNSVDTGLGNIDILNGQFTITAGNDAISAVNVLEIYNGTFNLTSGGGYPGKSTKTNTNGGGNMRPGGKATITTTTTSTEESKKGMKAGYIIIENGNITISSYEDALHSKADVTISNAAFVINAGDDGIHAESSVLINSGTVDIQNAYEGIEATNVTMKSGKININSTDDGVNVNNAKSVFTINGGEINVKANGDGLDSNGSIVVTGGTIFVDGPIANDNGAIDYDGSFAISGGTLVASGSAGMAEVPSTDSAQASILMFYSTVQSAQTTITLKDKSGTVVATYTPTKQYSSVAISSPALAVGSTYTLYKGDTKITDFKLSGTVTYLTESGVTTKAQNNTGRR